MEIFSYFNTKDGEPPKRINTSHMILKEYKGFIITHSVSSYLLVMKNIVIQETVGRAGATRLADYLISKNMTNDDPKTIAFNWKLKNIAGLCGVTV